MKGFKFLLVVIPFLFFSRTVSAAILEVDINRSKKYYSVLKAIEKVTPGDTILIHPGKYYIPSADGKSFINLPSGVALKGTDRFNCILKADKTGFNSMQLISVAKRENVKIENLTLDSPAGNIYLSETKNFVLKNCILRGWRVSKSNEKSIMVKDGTLSNSESSKILIERVLFEKCNPVYFGKNSSGVFKDNCLVDVKNTNFWHMPRSGWKYDTVYVHDTHLIKPDRFRNSLHNLADPETRWILVSDGFAWGAILHDWYPKKAKKVKTKLFADNFFDFGATKTTEEIQDEPPKKKKDSHPPEIYINRESQIREPGLFSSAHQIKGRIFDESGISLVMVNGKRVAIAKDGSFSSKVKLEGNVTGVGIQAVDTLGYKSDLNFFIYRYKKDEHDKAPPEIYLGKKLARGLKIVAAQSFIENQFAPHKMIQGYAIDPSGIKKVLVNGEQAELDKHHNFLFFLKMAQGENQVNITAYDHFGNIADKKIVINNPMPPPASDAVGPEINIVEAVATRNVGESASSEIIQGHVSDSSGIALFCINGEYVNMDDSGFFSHIVELKKGPNIIRVAAYDRNGNKSIKLINRIGLDPTDGLHIKGKYFALVIGNNNYQYLYPLKTAVKDAQVVSDLLKTHFGFGVKTLINASRSDILRRINFFRRTLEENDKFLIYYAGHGYYDQKTDAAYWLPVDAEKEDPTNWILAETITKSIKGNDAKSILVVSDSCYSGTLSGRKYRDAGVSLAGNTSRKVYIAKMLNSPSRMLLGSGGNEPVVDQGGAGGHSLFARAFIDSLSNMSKKDIFTVREIFSFIVTYVGGSSDQVPVLDIIRNSGHGSGVFVFKKTNK